VVGAEEGDAGGEVGGERPNAFRKPMSGFTLQRLVPRLTARLGSYWPTGTLTCTLPPTTRSWS
jgi:hypothetical protein